MTCSRGLVPVRDAVEKGDEKMYPRHIDRSEFAQPLDRAGLPHRYDHNGFPNDETDDKQKNDQRCQHSEFTFTIACRNARRYASKSNDTSSSTGSTIQMRLSRASPTPGTPSATFQIGSISAPVSLYPRHRLQHRRRPTPSDSPKHCDSFATTHWACGKLPPLPLEFAFYANSRHGRS